MNRPLLQVAVVLLVGSLVSSCATGHGRRAPADASRRVVTAALIEMYPTRRSDVHGLFHLRFIDAGGLLLRGKVTGLKAGLYGLGLHEKGDCSAFDGRSAGALIAGKDAGKTGPFGRLDDLTIEHDGTADIQRVEAKLSLSGPDSIVGRSLVIEAWPYDAKVDPASVPFVACGVIRAE